MDIRYPVYCPLMEEKVEIGTCFDIHNVVSGEAPKYTAPEKAVSKEGFKEICIKCPYHRYD